MTEKKRDMRFKGAIVSSPMRLIAFMIDFIFVLFFCRLALIALFLNDNWDTAPQSEILVSVIPAYIIGIILFFCRDFFRGAGLGKWFLNMRIAVLDTDLSVPGSKRLLKRNLPLIILPVEALYLIFNAHCRRLGDKIAGTVVIERTKIENFRFFTVRVIAFFAMFGLLWLSYIIISPIQIKKTEFYAVGRQFLEKELKTQYNDVNVDTFTEITRDKNDIILTFAVLGDKIPRSYRVFILSENGTYRIKKYELAETEE